ncbi:MAG: NapC/NirT family cytochrome c [Verrucomicrobia bacterium]|nr:NapC/NirT family cytochrome c [Verrucomicrobiota bacterium]
MLRWSAPLLALVCLGAQRKPSGTFQTDPVEVWGSRILVTVICFGIGVLLFTMLRYRGRTTGAVAWGLLIAGVGILPVVSCGFGTLLVFERAERVEFCASCHRSMQPYVADMKNPKSESLAALHFRNRYIPENQCYVCHRSYGLFGTAEAKVSGVVNVYRYYTRTFHRPVKMREPYPNRDCLKCHADSAKWQAQDQHLEQQLELFADTVKCLDCHESAHTLNGKEATP